MALIWTFRSYVDEAGVDVIKEWFDDATTQARGKFRSKLAILGKVGRNQWRRPLFDTLTDDGTGLWEVRFEANGVPWRPLGFFQREAVFTLVICATKTGNRWKPRNACALGLERKAEILKDAARCHDLPIPLE